jgi:hypothetical protein
MSEQPLPTPVETPPTDGGATPEPLPPTPTRTRYQQIATQFLQQFASAVAIIPNVESPHSSTFNFVRSHANAPIRFLGTVTAAVEQLPELQALNKLDTTAAHDKLQYIDAFRPVANTVATFLRSLGFTVNAHQASLTADSLQVYDIAKGIARDPGSANVAIWVELMKRDLGRSGRPRKTPVETPPSPATPAQPSAPTTPPKAAG